MRNPTGNVLAGLDLWALDFHAKITVSLSHLCRHRSGKYWEGTRDREVQKQVSRTKEESSSQTKS